MFVVNTFTSEKFECTIDSFQSSHVKLLKAGKFQFDWKNEIRKREVLRLFTNASPNLIQGLISFEEQSDHVFMNWIELASFNVGRNKVYDRIADLLIGRVAEISFERGYDGFLALIAKSALVDHYEKKFKAQRIGSSNRMIISGLHSRKLVTLLYED